MTHRPGHRKPRLAAIVPYLLLVGGAAAIVGAPTLGGGFVGGDDQRLVLNHVLVNHPSLEHALQLFTIVHRDLYQPIPLLSFSAEFAIGDALGLFDGGIEHGQWLFHATNVMLHVVNALLVWVLIVRLAGGLMNRTPRSASGSTSQSASGEDTHRIAYLTGTIAALLFAVHPLQVEVIAWINGRMMLLSTFFALSSMLTLIVWLRDGRVRWALVTVLLLLLCMISKVRVGVPMLMPIVAVACGYRLNRRFWPVFLVSTVLMIAAVVLNMWTTAQADLFSGAAENLSGPRPVRVLLSLAWYAQHFVWPMRLASWYHTPDTVGWLDTGTLWAVGTLALAAIVAVPLCKRWMAARLGLLWFLLTIADTLPFLPARNILAADRYMYLPIVGLVWLSAHVIVMAYRHVAQARSRRFAGITLATTGAVLGVVLTGVSWHIGSFYASSILKTARIAQLYPNVPHVWSRLAWAYCQAANKAERNGDMTTAVAHRVKAIELADHELSQANQDGWSEAYQARGSALLHLGRAEQALASFQKAVELDPEDGEPIYRLAMAYDDLGRFDEALPLFEKAVGMAPTHNPTVLRLAKLYRRLGRSDDARVMYDQALKNNPFEVPATLGLAELDIEVGTPSALHAAEQRLVAMLEWMPENVEARNRLGVVLQGLGRTSEAIASYNEALQRNPSDTTTAINLAQLYLAVGDRDSAEAMFRRAAAGRPESLEQVVVIENYLMMVRRFDEMVALWMDYVSRFPESADGRAHAAWSLALAGDSENLARMSQTLAGGESNHPLLLATDAFVALTAGDHEKAVARAQSLCDMGLSGADARQRLLVALEAFDEQHPGVPWTFYLVAQLTAADGRMNVARPATKMFIASCVGSSCASYASKLQALTGGTTNAEGESEPRPGDAP